MITHSLPRLLTAWLVTALLSVAPLASLANEDAEAIWSQIRAVSSAPMTALSDPTAKSLSREQRDAIVGAAGELTVFLGEKFLRDFPQEARRWEVIQAMISAQRRFHGDSAVERKATWEQRRAELVAHVMNDPTAPSEIVGNIASGQILSALHESKPVNLGRARAAVKVLRERAVDASMRPTVERLYLEGTAAIDQEAALREARQLTGDKNPEVAGAARSWIASIEFKTKPLELRFPDLDGREIDLSRYRGKVVLLDFWATWCVPCMEQMPHLREIYGKYHAQGFEVIGITDDIPVLNAAKPRPVEKTVETLKAFLAQHDMPWPQLWDTRSRGPGPKGLLQQFAIRELPTYLLFDRNGMFVTADLRGEKLEAEVRRLLAQ